MEVVLGALADSATSNQLFIFLFSIVVKGAFILAATGVVALLLRNSAASLRHMIWMCGLTTVLILPVVMVALPGWTVPIIPERLAKIVDGVTATNPASSASFRELSFNEPSNAPVDLDKNRSWTVQTESGTTVFSQDEARASAEAIGAGSVGSTFSPSAALETGSSIPLLSNSSFQSVVENLSGLPWTAWAILVWLTGVFVLLGRLMIAHLSVAGLIRRAERVDDDGSQLLLEKAARQLGLRKHVRLRKSDWLSVPVSVGLRRPSIVLPAHADDWDADTLHTVLLHELAHVQRRDCLIQLFVEVTRSLFWINPMIWVAAYHMKHERERACDDAVIVSGTTPSSYAQALLDIARSITDRELSGAAVMAMARKSELEGRLLDILDSRPKLRTVNRAAAILSVAVILSFALPVSVLELATAGERGWIESEIAEREWLHESHNTDDDDPVEVTVIWQGHNDQPAVTEHDKSHTWSWSSTSPNSSAPTNGSGSQSAISIRSDLDNVGAGGTSHSFVVSNGRDQQNRIVINRSRGYAGTSSAVSVRTDKLESLVVDEVDLAIAELSARIKGLQSALDAPIFETPVGNVQSDHKDDLLRALRKSNMHFTSSEVSSLRRAGVDADLIYSVSKAGLNFCPSEFVALAEAGVDEDFINGVRKSGYRFSSDDLLKLVGEGVDEDLMKHARRAGYTFSANDFVTLVRAGVDEELLVQARNAGFTFSAKEFVLLTNSGVDGDLLRQAGKSGYRFSARDFSALQHAGVDEDLIAASRKAGYSLSAKDLVRLSHAGIDEDVFHRLRKSGITSASVSSIIQFASRGSCSECISG